MLTARNSVNTSADGFAAIARVDHDGACRDVLLTPRAPIANPSGSGTPKPAARARRATRSTSVAATAPALPANKAAARSPRAKTALEFFVRERFSATFKPPKPRKFNLIKDRAAAWSAFNMLSAEERHRYEALEREDRAQAHRNRTAFQPQPRQAEQTASVSQRVHMHARPAAREAEGAITLQPQPSASEQAASASQVMCVHVRPWRPARALEAAYPAPAPARRAGPTGPASSCARMHALHPAARTEAARRSPWASHAGVSVQATRRYASGGFDPIALPPDCSQALAFVCGFVLRDDVVANDLVAVLS